MKETSSSSQIEHSASVAQSRSDTLQAAGEKTQDREHVPDASSAQQPKSAFSPSSQMSPTAPMASLSLLSSPLMKPQLPPLADFEAESVLQDLEFKVGSGIVSNSSTLMAMSISPTMSSLQEAESVENANMEPLVHPFSTTAPTAIQDNVNESRSHYYKEYESHLYTHRRPVAGQTIQSFKDSHDSSSKASLLNAEKNFGQHHQRDSFRRQQLNLISSSSSPRPYPQEISPDDHHSRSTWRPARPPAGTALSKPVSLAPSQQQQQQQEQQEQQRHAPQRPLSTTDPSLTFKHLSSSSQSISGSQHAPSTHHPFSEESTKTMRWNPPRTKDRQRDGLYAHLDPRSSRPIDFETDDRQLSLDNCARPLTDLNDRSRTLPSLAPKPHGVSIDDASTTAVSTTIQTQYSQPQIFMDNTVAHGGSPDTSRPKVTSARGTPKGPLPIEVQLKLLSSVLRHDPFNCPIRRTTQVWECIAQEQGIRARTCARRYDNILQASIAGRDRPMGTEEQMTAKRKLLEQLFEMMNQPQALVRMQKKRRYRSEEADRQLLLETIRLNPFGQKVGHVAKAWEDVRDALQMKVHARQCIRRVNRMIKPYLLRERMYKGNIPKEMQEVNDELVKQVIQLMQQSGHGESLEDEVGNSNEDESASDSDDQGEGEENRYQEEDELEDDRDEIMASPSESSPTRTDTTQVPSTRPATPGMSGPPLGTSTAHTTPAQRGRLRNSGQGPWEKKSESMDPSVDESRSVRVEFRPQRIWGSHPYSKDVLSRSGSGSQRSRSGHTLHAKSGNYHRSAKYVSTNSKVQDDESNVGTHYHPAESERETSAIKSPLSETSSRPVLPSPTSSLASTSMLRHGREGEHHRYSDRSTAPTEPTSQLYYAILDEFHTIKTYLGQMDGQRQRDKHNQQIMYQMMERMQQQLHQQQQTIQDLQNQLQSGFQHSYQNSPPHQHQHRRSSSPHHDCYNGDSQVQSGDGGGSHSHLSSGEYRHRSSEGSIGPG